MKKIDKWEVQFCFAFAAFILFISLFIPIRLLPWLFSIGIMTSIVVVFLTYKYMRKMPSRIILDEHGIILHFRTGRRQRIHWDEMASLYLSIHPGRTVGDAAIYLENGKRIELSYESAVELKRRHGLATNKELRANDGSGRINMAV